MHKEYPSMLVVEQHLSTLISSDTFDWHESRRLFHGRGHCYPGWEFLSIDIFYPAIIVTVFENYGEHWEEALTEKLMQLCSSVEAVYIQRRYQKPAFFELAQGETLTSLQAKRGDLNFHLSLSQQNIGFFLDIEPARQWLESICKHKHILNLFSYTCAFSVVAMAAGARSVVNMDLSSKSLTVGRENHLLNGHDLRSVNFYANDIFKSWGRLKREGLYDIVIIDPPSYQKGSFVATKDYAKVLRRMSSLTKEDGYVLVCLNSPDILLQDFQLLVDEHLDGFEFQSKLASHEDFPDVDKARALKLLVYKKV